jgi:phasin family protein
MSKAKSTAEKATLATESAVHNGADAISDSFKKAVKGYETAVEFSKENIEAYKESAAIAGRAAETIGGEIMAYSKQSIEDSVAAGKAIMASKSIHEAIELQTDYAKSAFEAYVSQMSKFGELFATTTKDSFAPIQGRVQAFVEGAQSLRA